MSSSPPRSNVHPLVTNFVARNKIDPQSLRSNGSVTILIDGRHRITLNSSNFNRVVLAVQLRALDGRFETTSTDEFLQRLMQLGAGMLQQSGATLCLDARREALMLQQALPPDADIAALEAAIAELSHILPFWTKMCSQEAQSFGV